jgi:hypothetical protein
MTLDELEWVPRSSGPRDSWEAASFGPGEKFYIERLIANGAPVEYGVYARLTSVKFHTDGMPEVQNPMWFHIDALTAQCLLNHITSGGNNANS